MNIACPHCGTQATQLGCTAPIAGSAEFAFQCLSRSCGKKFTGVLTLSRADPGNVQRFSDGSGKPLTDAIGTDC